MGPKFVGERYCTMSEDLAHYWVPPAMLESGQFLPCIYTRSTPASIFEHASKYWLKD